MGGMSEASVTIEGLDEAIAKCSPALIAGPLRAFWERACISVENRARETCVVDTGRLRSSIGHEIDNANVPEWAKVGSSVYYAPFVEYGTGRFATGEGGGGGDHWPPGEALDQWASTHGFASGAQVAGIIGRRGGLMPKPFLGPAFENSTEDINRALELLKSEIAAGWGR